MRKILLLLAAAAALFASGITWEKDLTAAAAKAKSEHKKVMILMSSQSCRYCKQMHREVFANPAIADYINQNFVALELDIERDRYPEALEVRGVPTTFFFSPDFKEGYKKVVGPRHPMLFLNILRQVEGQ